MTHKRHVAIPSFNRLFGQREQLWRRGLNIGHPPIPAAMP